MAKGAKITRTEDVVTREYTIHLRKLLHGVGFKKRAPRSVDEVKKFAKKMMGTEVRNRPILFPVCTAAPASTRCALQQRGSLRCCQLRGVAWNEHSSTQPMGRPVRSLSILSRPCPPHIPSGVYASTFGPCARGRDKGGGEPSLGLSMTPPGSPRGLDHREIPADWSTPLRPCTKILCVVSSKDAN